jgi:hypothetical protein
VVAELNEESSDLTRRSFVDRDSISSEEKSMRKRKLVAYTLVAVLLGGGVVLAQRPKDNVNAKRHPNLAAAQRLSTQAYERINAAQKANEWDMQGHAQKAKDLLEQANNELKEAAEAANKDAK